MRQFPRAICRFTTAALAFIPAAAEAGSALRWGPLGHRVVAEIAMNRLSPAVADETRRLLGGQTLADVATWADERRRDLPNTATWHYVDIEITDSTYVPARDCKEDACIVAALNAQIAILSDHSRPDADRATALKWVVHLVGDIHQPLHAGERGDRGGNDVAITFGGRRTNLHALWDSGLLVSYGQTDGEIVHQIEGEIIQRTDIAALVASTPAQWAVGSHNIARDVVYRNLPPSLDITPAYTEAARPVIRERLLRAGVRLAAVLERAMAR
jgi:nuclease S1